MRLLVTGGAGFIGSNFILYWFKNHPEDQVVNFDALTYAGNLENLISIEKNPNYRFVKGDIANVNEVNSAMEGVDAVVHFAAETHVDRSISGPAPFVMSNVLGTQVLLDSARKNNIKRFHHVSTDEVFGQLELDSDEKFNESTCYDPRSPYSASKASSDHLVRAYFHTYNFPVTITNCSNNFGPYQFPEKIIPLAITNVLEEKKIPIYGDGLYVRDWLYVEDHCRGIDLVLSRGKIGETYCLGGMTEDINNLEVAKKIAGLLGKDETVIEFVKDRPGHDRRYAVDFSKAKNELGWEPRHTFEEWLKTTVEWYKTNEAWWKKVKSGEYKKYYEEQYKK
ncbi:MAG: dTDP-glucose 4,6-dehydratase [Candidatus Levybacteria bacterium RIFOXYA1_FULL_41_10]|nr:MAG: dTDP-glucose 4,6-dehydratase [Candidatus Levybacteria bacterium GW2011_GWA2_41_15]OGH25278.1 MAG: dTDP-glucose 4,6-dehydratase [Candidatus Levybacteria bacterium RIFCSPHIGHO2_02_FULL_40_29]OGH32187.1 MAG: dTDP-glucose 4,6-dehydratase [Candidatus Levybacteria bacterium RIFCSPHIGHO2_12_FULL_40_44]OGH50608.1 MAG: dTDP-glucose 4,6-dehydratase [Candidatus Levybacteria bacterium RIFCSPLOWO2_02_FULL_40_18]OGH52946.1 MAG: dTDP-glucose 4,6-dehydratase [Candidatus Levybacteria bacterium RIFCSPLOW